MRRRRPLWVLVAILITGACAGQTEGTITSQAPFTIPPLPTVPNRSTTTTTIGPDGPLPGIDPTREPPTVMVGAASRSVLPTIGGTRDYLAEAPGWDDIDPDDPGYFTVGWDQGTIDVGNGLNDAAWVHDDLRVSAVAFAGITPEDPAVIAATEATTTTIDRFAPTTTTKDTTTTTLPPTTTTTLPPRPTPNGETVVMVSTDLYMIFAADAAEIERRALALLDGTVAAGDSLRVVISATHNHHGPDTAFSVNDDWYSLMADETASAIAEAVLEMEPATLVANAGEHRFGVADTRDPLIIDPRLNVMQARKARSGKPIATIVQWANHPETTLNFAPPIRLRDACAAKGWRGDDCTAEGRYFTADYPGLMRTRIQGAFGGEVLYFNGAIGSQIGPGDADVWRIDEFNPLDPLSNGIAPADALPVGGAEDFRDKNFARTQTIGDQLAAAALTLIVDAEPVTTAGPVWDDENFFTPLTNIGFRALLASGDLGWQNPVLYTCGPRPFTEASCQSDAGAVVDDPVLTPLVDAQIRSGDVLKSRVISVDFGDVGFLFMPGELPPEIVIGLPADFVENSAAYFSSPENHAAAADYAVPPPLVEQMGDDIAFTVGLGGDELGYWVPLADVRVKCEDVALSGELSCADLFEARYLVTADAAEGPACRNLADNPALLTQEDADLPYRLALAEVCRYGQALGRELGEPDGHYEETNSAGWDLVSDMADAAEALLSR